MLFLQHPRCQWFLQWDSRTHFDRGSGRSENGFHTCIQLPTQKRKEIKLFLCDIIAVTFFFRHRFLVTLFFPILTQSCGCTHGWIYHAVHGFFPGSRRKRRNTRYLCCLNFQIFFRKRSNFSWGFWGWCWREGFHGEQPRETKHVSCWDTYVMGFSHQFLAKFDGPTEVDLGKEDQKDTWYI